MITHILFDLDGTIIDSEPAALEAILACTKEWGVPVSYADAATVAGKKWEVAFDLIYDKFKLPLSKKAASETIVARFKKDFRSMPKVVPGVVQAIESFASVYPLGLVSGSHRDDIFWALDHLKIRDKFQVIYGAEDYAGSKPSPEGYNLAIRTLGAASSNCLVFEDSEAGIQSGLSAGCKVVAIKSTNHFGHDQSKAQKSIQDFVHINSAWVAREFKA